MIDDDIKEIAALLANVQRAEPGAAHTARVRSRCRSILARRRRPAAIAFVAQQTVARYSAWTAFVAGFCVIYFSAIVVRAVQLVLLIQP